MSAHECDDWRDGACSRCGHTIDSATVTEQFPHEGDCGDTLCPACGCCGHCATDDHCTGAEGCEAEGCMCLLIWGSEP